MGYTPGVGMESQPLREEEQVTAILSLWQSLPSLQRSLETSVAPEERPLGPAASRYLRNATSSLRSSMHAV